MRNRIALLACLALSQTLIAQQPSVARVSALVAKYPSLTCPGDPAVNSFIHDPFVRLEAAPHEIEQQYNGSLQQLEAAELALSEADAAVAASRERERAASQTLEGAKAVLDTTNHLMAQHGLTAAEPLAAMVVAQQRTMQAASAYADAAHAERVTAEEYANPPLVAFQHALAQEEKIRAQREQALPTGLRRQGIALGIGMQRSTILIQFRDDARMDEIDAVLGHYALSVVGGIPELSLFIVRVPPGRSPAETDVEDVLRVKRIAASLPGEFPNIVASATQEVALQAAPTHVATTALASHSTPCWAWYDAPPAGPASSQLIHLTDAWNFVRTNHPSTAAVVPVAVIDEGFLPASNELSLSAVATCTPSNYIHGVEVAGILNGTAGNGAGISGQPIVQIETCSFNPLVIQSVEDDEISFVRLICALRELLAQRKYHVINLSISYNWYQHLNRRQLDASMLRIVENQGRIVRSLLAPYTDSVVVVSAAGNDCLDNACPDSAQWMSPVNWAALGHSKSAGVAAQSANVIVVEAVDDSGTTWMYSNRGGHVSAPGANLLTCLDGSNAAIGGGTSLSAPIVSGIVALMYAQNPALNASHVRALLGAGSTAPVVNAGNAIRNAQREAIHAAADLNGDGRLSRTATYPVASCSVPLTDLEVMQAVWDDPKVRAADLDALIDH